MKTKERRENNYDHEDDEMESELLPINSDVIFNEQNLLEDQKIRQQKNSLDSTQFSKSLQKINSDSKIEEDFKKEIISEIFDKLKEFGSENQQNKQSLPVKTEFKDQIDGILKQIGNHLKNEHNVTEKQQNSPNIIINYENNYNYYPDRSKKKRKNKKKLKKSKNKKNKFISVKNEDDDFVNDLLTDEIFSPEIPEIWQTNSNKNNRISNFHDSKNKFKI